VHFGVLKIRFRINKISESGFSKTTILDQIWINPGKTKKNLEFVG
jgi:hypothetical protein